VTHIVPLMAIQMLLEGRAQAGGSGGCSISLMCDTPLHACSIVNILSGMHASGWAMG
jgi:hypothetical protein